MALPKKLDTRTIAKNHHSIKSLLALLASAFSLSAGATDLIETYRLAQTNDATFRSAKYALEGIRQKIPQARAALLPAVTATGSKGTTQAETSFTGVPTVDRKMQSWAWTLQLTQPLIRLGSVYAYQQSIHIVEQAEAQYEQAKQELLLRVAQAYFDASVAQEVIDAAGAEVRALEEQLKQVTRGFKAGTHSIIDVDETKSRLGLARSKQVATTNDLESKRAELEKITGTTLARFSVLKTAVMPPEPVPRDSRAWMEQARITNPLVRLQRASLEAARIDIKKSKSAYAPTLDFVASYGNSYSSNSLTTPNEYATRSNSTQIGVQLNIPIFSGGETNSRVTESIANHNKVESDLEAASRQAATDAQQAYASVMNGLAQIDALKYATEAGENSVKGNRMAFRLGVRINLDVLNAEQQLYTAKRDLAAARYETLLQGLKLKAATGSLTEDDLIAINGMMIDSSHN
jgi:outer membrane protein